MSRRVLVLMITCTHAMPSQPRVYQLYRDSCAHWYIHSIIHMSTLSQTYPHEAQPHPPTRIYTHMMSANHTCTKRSPASAS